ncbi:MAG: hypothetical protein P1V35_16685, partial [Planctomycetota bacterium]|nr:hypothetical protein [Planctomycetota bacterium]
MKTPAIHGIAAAILANTTFAEVLTVGASPADHSQISAAIAAALDGDTILVDPGSYSDLTVDDKALTIVPRIPGTTYHVSRVLIQDLASNKRTYLRGVVAGGTVTIRNCQGSVRLDDSVGWGWLRVMDSMDVALRTLTIPTGGATISDSQVGIFDSSFVGNPGPILFLDGGDGGPGLVRSGTGEVFLSDCSVTGGRGGDGAFGLSNGTGGNGGHAIISNGDVFVQSCTLQGGAGGFGGLASGGLGGLGSGFTAEPGVASSVDVPASILDSKPIVLTFRGQPGDMVEYAFSPFGQVVSNGTDVGRLVMDAAMGSGFIPAGNIPANGELRVTMHMGDTPSQGSN